MKHILTCSVPGNPRNSEGSFIKLADGTLYFAYSRYTGSSHSDHAAADIAAVTSRDNGATWSEPFIVHKNQKINLMSVSLLRLQNGTIAMVVLEKSAIPGRSDEIDCRPKIIFSEDEAKSWSEAVDITNIPPAYLVINNDRLVQLKSGRLIIPAAHHQYIDSGMGDAIIKFFISDDNGRSWRLVRNHIYPPAPMLRGLMEPGVIELNNGALMCFIRTAVGCQYKAYSYDQGESWTHAMPFREFISPESPMSMKRDPVSGKLYAVWNDRNALRCVRATEKSRHRTPLVLAESSDDGVTWQNHQILEDAPDHGYCYIAMYFDGNLLHLGYCCGGGEDSAGILQQTCLNTIKLR